MTEEQKDERRRQIDTANERARDLLKPGDWLVVAGHGCSTRTIRVKFSHWEGPWLCTPTLSDLLAINIVKVNGHGGVAKQLLRDLSTAPVNLR